MMPDLGRYALEVTSAYAISLAILLALVLVVWRRSSTVRRQLHEVEARRKQVAKGMNDG